MKWIESQHSEGLLWKVCCVFLQVFVSDILWSDGECRQQAFSRLIVFLIYFEEKFRV